jgi:phosphoglycolate phosphatase
MYKVHELLHHQAKPDPSVLFEICESEGISPSQAAYVGDSIARDILMAKKARVFSVWAAYGAHHDAEQYEKLVRISHWTHDDVKREKQLKAEASAVRPDYVLKNSFSEILVLFRIHADLSRATTTPN